MNRGSPAFTLVEALLAIATLALLASGIAVLYASGQRAFDAQEQELRICSALRSEMERVMALPFDSRTNSTGITALQSRKLDHLISVTRVDMDGDSAVDQDAMRITVQIEDRQLSMLVVNPQDRLGKH